MLHAGRQLAQYIAWHVSRVLGDEEHAHALGADQADGQLDLVKQLLGAILKQQVRLVKEEHHLRQILIAALGQQLIQLAQHPQHEGGIKRRAQEELVSRQDVDHAAAFPVAHKPVGDVERRLAEELIAALVLQHRDGALDGADGGLGDVAVLQRIVRRALAHVGQHRPQVLQIDQQQALFIRDAEHQVKHARLGLVDLQHAGQEKRAHLGHCGADGVAGLAEHIPEGHRAGAVGVVGHAGLIQPVHDAFRALAGLGQARQISLDIRHEHRHAQLREALRQHLQGHRLPCAGRPRDHTMTVGHLGQQAHSTFRAGSDPYLVV